MNKYCVYRHVFPDGMIYIGACTNPKRRWGRGSGYFYDKNIYSMILNHGWANIKHEILFDNLSKVEAFEKESELIKKLKRETPLFCINKIVHTRLPPEVSDITRQKNRLSSVGRKQSKEFCNMIKELHTGNSYRKGATVSKETRKKISDSHLGIKAYNAKAVLQFTPDMQLIKEWDCIMDIQRELGFLNNAIVAHLKGKSTLSYGYIWRYKNG